MPQSDDLHVGKAAASEDATREAVGDHGRHLTEVVLGPAMVTLKLDGAPMAIIRVQSGANVVWRVRLPNMRLSCGAFANSERAIAWIASGRPLPSSADEQPRLADLVATLVKRRETRDNRHAPTAKKVEVEHMAADRKVGTNMDWRVMEPRVKADPKWKGMEPRVKTVPEWKVMERKVGANPI